MKKFQERMKGVLPPEELPSFFSALEEMGKDPRKSIRLRRDLPSDTKWTPARLVEEGIPLGERVPWYDRGYFFDLARMEPHPSRHPLVAAGLVFIQEAGAMEVVPELGVKPHHLVLDLCAAPGAKSSQIGEYLGQSPGGASGWLVANEPVRERAKLLDAILARHGIGNSTVYNLEPHRLAKVFPEVFDRILVDAPCSGESLFAKREEKRGDVTDKEVDRCALRQTAILESAARMLAPGGCIVYSTCAYSRVENEEVTSAFLDRHPEFRLQKEVRRYPHRDGVPGGYFAVLVHSGGGVVHPSFSARCERLQEGIRTQGDRGLVRDGLMRWDHAPDHYAIALDRKTPEKAPLEFEIRELSREEAVAFLTDPVSFSRQEKSKNVLYLWERERIAVAFEGRNLYPKTRLR
jgi:16S rRNA C967 or C1407 C5-methylase (RsmB/RsmF family)